MIDKNNPNTWGELFDEVITLLERGELVEGVDEFDMGSLHSHAPNCGTVACLFGSVALLVGVTDEVEIWRLFAKWEEPYDTKMSKIWLLCYKFYLTAAEVIEEYRKEIA